MRKYRLAYDCLFLPKDISNGIVYNGEKILDIRIFFIYKAINKETRKEKFFHDEEPREQIFPYSATKSCYINDFYKCVVDIENGYKMILDKTLSDASLYEVSYEIGDCFKCIGGIPTDIPYKEFVDILLSNIESFYVNNNNPTQSTSCYYQEVFDIGKKYVVEIDDRETTAVFEKDGTGFCFCIDDEFGIEWVSLDDVKIISEAIT